MTIFRLMKRSFFVFLNNIEEYLYIVYANKQSDPRA